jgi:hypothetical protein
MRRDAPSVRCSARFSRAFSRTPPTGPAAAGCISFSIRSVAKSARRKNPKPSRNWSLAPAKSRKIRRNGALAGVGHAACCQGGERNRVVIFAEQDIGRNFTEIFASGRRGLKLPMCRSAKDFACMGNSNPVEAGPHEQDLPRKTRAESQRQQVLSQRKRPSAISLVSCSFKQISVASNHES